MRDNESIDYEKALNFSIGQVCPCWISKLHTAASRAVISLKETRGTRSDDIANIPRLYPLDTDALKVLWHWRFCIVISRKTTAKELAVTTTTRPTLPRRPQRTTAAACRSPPARRTEAPVSEGRAKRQPLPRCLQKPHRILVG